MKIKNKLLIKNHFMWNGYFIHKYSIQSMKFNHVLTNIYK